jgi:hypothetical protein
MVPEVLPFGPGLCGLPRIYKMAKFVERTFPDVGRLCVMVPKKTENRLRFSVRLADGTPEVRFELAFRT